MDSSASTPSTNGREIQPDETAPLLLNPDEDDLKTVKAGWKAPPGFLWIEIGKNN
jgi:hypothetical protein